ncbi:MAG: biopolymer transporter ExbD [Halobacteriovoraceae bacterium]|jgi:biopolymer transport protein ExbD|nr:biopolymer transporter ExbD [Halobacteriovoraceae bacterium]MBT5095012.1 biopolymer transporter ExbD [Halobacteriovoraceae bacterium]
MKKRTRESAMPDITPLIDVVFLLLIFFMVSTVFKKDEMALLLNLPKMTKGESKQQKKENIFVELSVSEIAINGQKTSLESIDTILGGFKNKEVPIELRIDKEVTYNRMIGLLDHLKKFELTNLSLITEN